MYAAESGTGFVAIPVSVAERRISVGDYELADVARRFLGEPAAAAPSLFDATGDEGLVEQAGHDQGPRRRRHPARRRHQLRAPQPETGATALWLILLTRKADRHIGSADIGASHTT